MGERMVPIADGFWNIRGSFKLLGMLDLGTHSSLVRLGSGRFVLLDSYTLDGNIADEVLARTDGGKLIDAVLNLHPFHTVHVKAVAERFPQARLYGTERHHAKFPQLDWAPERTESPECAALFSDDFDFMVPQGVDFVPSNSNLHFASVLAFHRASRTLHVDDTLNFLPFPMGDRLGFHPTLGQVLERRPGAASDFEEWAESLIERSKTVDRVCTAHARLAGAKRLGPTHVQVSKALERVQGTLRKHAQKYDRGDAPIAH